MTFMISSCSIQMQI